MIRTSIQFFATASEQRSWLKRFILANNVWCVMQSFPPFQRIEQFTDIDFLNIVPFEQVSHVGGVQMYFGNRRLAETPVWRVNPNGCREIDFIRSQAIQYVPSVTVDDKLLLIGQIAIMQKVYYKEAGVDFASVRLWYEQFANSLAEMNCVDYVILRDPGIGKERRYKDIVATAGALEWQKSGRQTKQFAEGKVEFILQGRY